LYWWAGRDMAYFTGAAGMFGVCALVLGSLKNPVGLKVKPTSKKPNINGGVSKKENGGL
jgi:hypothetical protein